MSYIPATQADADLIASYLPKPHADGSPILPSELPTSLPGYLINLKAQINLDGVAVATSSTALQMGTDLQSTGGFTQLSDPTQWDLTSEESNVVGQATAIGISAGGISAVQLTQLKDRMMAMKAKVEVRDYSDLTSEHISGDQLTANIWSWFAVAETHNQIAQNQAGMIENQGLSYGLIHAIAQPVYSWGVIRKVTFPGVNMDIGHIRPIGYSKNNDKNTWIAYNRTRGSFMSSLEHAIPERFFNDPAQCNPEGTSTPKLGLPVCQQGISAVKAISIAASQGQKIFTITNEVYQANPNIINSALSAHSSSTKQAVQNALDIGHEVTIHETPITQSGWTGAGYTTIDPQTGAGGYMIEGGLNGGIFNLVGAAFGGLADALTKKLRNPDAVNGPLNELTRSKILTNLANIASIVAFIDQISNIVTDDNVSTPKKIAQIVFTLAFSIAAMEGAAALGIFFAAPAAGAVFAVGLAVALGFLLLQLNLAIAEL